MACAELIFSDRHDATFNHEAQMMPLSSPPMIYLLIMIAVMTAIATSRDFVASLDISIMPRLLVSMLFDRSDTSSPTK